MKRIFGVLMALLFAAATLNAQMFDYKTRQFAATDFNNWTSYTTATVAVGAATITIENPWQPTVPGWGTIQPFAVNRVLLMDVGSSVEEEVTVTAASCATPTSCTVTGTFANAHAGRWRVKSGTFGAQEALDFAIGVGGGRVVVPTTFLGVTADITGLIAGGTGVDLVDLRSGGEIWYGWSGTAYTALFGSSDTFTFAANQTSTATALAATLTAVAPAPRAAFTGAPGTNANLVLGATGASATANQLVAAKTRATTAGVPATTTIVSADDILAIRGYGADGTNYIEAANITLDTEGTIAATRVPGVIRFSTGTDAAPTVLTTALTIDSAQMANFTGVVVSPTYRASTTAPAATVTAAAPAPRFFNSAAPATNANIAIASGVASAVGAQVVAFKTRDTTAGAPATTTIVSADDLLQLRGFGADGTNYVEAARIEFDTEGTVALTRVPGVIRFSTGTDAAPTVLTTALTIDSAQLANFTGVVVSPTFRASATAPAATVTAQAPSPRFFNATAPASNANLAIASGVASNIGAQVVAFKTRDTTAGAPATTTVVTADDILQLRGFGADGTNYVEATRIEFDTEGTIALTRVPGVIRFSTGTDAAPTVLTTALTIDSAQAATFTGQINTAAGGINRTSAALVLKTTTSGNITINPAAAATAAVTTNTRFEHAAGANVATANNLTLGGDGNLFTLTGVTAVNCIDSTGWQAGSVITLITASTPTITDAQACAGAFKALQMAGNLIATADDTIRFVFDGTDWKELSRSVN